MDLKDKVFGLEAKELNLQSHRSSPGNLLPETLEDGLSLKFLKSLDQKIQDKFDHLKCDVKISFENIRSSINKVEAKLRRYIDAKEQAF